MIKLIKSTFYKEQDTKNKLCEFISSAEMLSMGRECRKFEEKFAKKQGRKFAVFVNSGSSANLVLLQALMNLGRFKKGDKVGVSALTWGTNVMPVIQMGLLPVAIDCEIDSLNVSSNALEKRIEELKGFFLTNALGFSHDIAKIKDICDKKGIVFIEDNCEGLGSKTNGVLLGNFGLASTFSFFVGHHISTIEGGMICTDDEELYFALITARAHGWDRNLPVSAQQKLRNYHDIEEFYSKYVFYELGFNIRPTEISGFLGNIQIDYWDEIVSGRQDNFKIFQEAEEKNDDFLTIKAGHMDIVSNFAMPVICKNRDDLEKYKNRFFDNNIEIRPIIAGDITKQPFYKKYVSSSNNCPNAQFIHKNSFYFPNNPELDSDELNLLVELLKK
ncbi:MAG: DegT/DnrJ/EryC1/StrS aminotransferase family protein [Patescibacteria group bacterium]